MATLRPNWFLISPVLTASGQCSLINWKRSGQDGKFGWKTRDQRAYSRLIPIVNYQRAVNQVPGEETTEKGAHVGRVVGTFDR